MSIAPLHGRPAPLLFSRREEHERLQTVAPGRRHAPLSTRARRERAQRRLRWVTIGAMFIAALAGAIGVGLLIRG